MALIHNPENIEGECFALQKRDMVVKADGSPLQPSDLQVLSAKAICSIAEPENSLTAIELSTTDCLPEGYVVKTIRQSFAELVGEGSFRLARSRALLTWHMNTKFCSCCGGRLLLKDKETAKYCPTCGTSFFPRIEPCIIVLVHKDDQILLARHAQRNQDVYSCLAGFIEVGEDAEHAVAREIFEETGIKVKNITYRGSQSWPFPDQLMLAYTAEYESGEIRVQEEEIANAAWFPRNNCPATPKPGSIAYRLIHQLY